MKKAQKMRRTRSFKINRRLLVAAAIIYTFIITFFLVFNLDEQNWIRIRHDYVCLIMIIAFILPVPLFFCGFKISGNDLFKDSSRNLHVLAGFFSITDAVFSCGCF